MKENFLTCFQINSLILFFFLSRQCIIYLSKKIAKECIERLEKNTTLMVCLIAIVLYLFLTGYYIIDYFFIESLYNSPNFYIKFLWLTLFPTITLTLHFMSEKTSLLLKNILLIRQSYFLLTALFAILLVSLYRVPDIENIKENLAYLIQYKNNQSVDELFVDFSFHLENQFVFAFQLIWFFLFINLLGIFLDPNTLLFYKILFVFLGPLFPGLGFFTQSSQLNVISNETKILVQKPLKVQNTVNKSNGFNTKIQTNYNKNTDLLSSSLRKEITRLAEKNNITPIKNNSELAMTFFTQVARCITKTKTEFFKNVEKVTNLLGTSDGIISEKGVHHDYPELKEIITVNRGIASYKNTADISYERSLNTFNSVVKFKKDFENTFNMKFDNAKNAIAIRQNNLFFLNPLFIGMDPEQKLVLQRSGITYK